MSSGNSIPATPWLVAVVDDDAMVRKALARVLRAGDLCVETHGSGTELLLSLEHSRPHCIVLDVHMPGRDGFEVQAALAHDGHTIPVVMITGHHDARNCARAKALGAFACLPKPVDVAELLDTIAASIQGGYAPAA